MLASWTHASTAGNKLASLSHLMGTESVSLFDFKWKQGGRGQTQGSKLMWREKVKGIKINKSCDLPSGRQLGPRWPEARDTFVGDVDNVVDSGHRSLDTNNRP